MRVIGQIVFAAVAVLWSSGALDAQVPFAGKKIRLRRALPPAVELEARSFSITASSQEKAGEEVAASFREMFKAKIQGDDRFIYDDKNPALRVTIVVTRFYVEVKQLTNPATKGNCMTHLGNLQGTFSVVESATGRPLASDALGWKLQTTEAQHVLVADDERTAPVRGPKEKMSLQSLWNVGEDKGGLPKIPFVGKRPSPCDVPLTQNEARDILADAFLTDILHLATPYTIIVEVPVPGGKQLKTAVEEAIAERWPKSLEIALAIPEQPKKDDEGERLYVLGLAYEGLGYKQGERAFEVNKSIHSKLPEDEMARQKAELRRIVDLAKEYFDKASLSFTKANEAKAEVDYRNGERRADQSRRLYARIQKYRDLKPEEPKPKEPSKMTMSEIVDLCTQGLDASIIVYRIEHAAVLAVTDDQFGELAKCKEKQSAIFPALVKRMEAKK